MKKTLLTLTIALCIHTGLNAQITSSKFTITPATTVYIVMPDTVSEVSKQYIEVYKKYWTFTKYRFIMPEEKEELTKPGNYFFGFSCYKRKDYNSRTFKDELTYMQVFLNLYQFEKEEKKKDTKESFLESAFASFLLPMNNRNYFDQLIPGTFYFGNHIEMDKVSYDLDDNLFMWGPGLLKNYVQKLGIIIKNKKAAEEETKSSVVDNKADLSKLKTSTLYIPDYCFFDYNKMTNTWKKETSKKEEMLEKYIFGHEVISSEDLNRKILESEEEFYYLVYTSDAPRKYINIISSKTGKIIYSEFKALSYEFNKGDIKDLMKAIEEG